MQPRKERNSRSEDTKSENKMSREDRAKQFMPFAALKGISGGDAQEGKRKLCQGAKKNDRVTVVYFLQG